MRAIVLPRTASIEEQPLTEADANRW